MERVPRKWLKHMMSATFLEFLTLSVDVIFVLRSPNAFFSIKLKVSHLKMGTFINITLRALFGSAPQCVHKHVLNEGILHEAGFPRANLLGISCTIRFLLQ